MYVYHNDGVTTYNKGGCTKYMLVSATHSIVGFLRPSNLPHTQVESTGLQDNVVYVRTRTR